MFTGQSWEQLRPIIFEHGTSAAISAAHIVLIVIIGWIGIRVLRRLLVKMEHLLVKHRDGDSEGVRVATEKRIRTLTGLMSTVIGIAVWALVLVSTLNEIGINIGPILAGVGIAGLAIGFGAQNLVRDVISGFFMILENQVRVGDVAVVNGTGGLVESISFRTIVLRDISGIVHVFPHGTVTTLANHTMYWSAYVIDVGIAYDEDVDRAIEVMRKVGEGMRTDPKFDRKILEPIEIFGVDSFGQSEIVIKARLKTRPAEQWTVGREYRRRLKYAFDREGIQIPFPQRVVHISGASGAGPTTPLAAASA